MKILFQLSLVFYALIFMYSENASAYAVSCGSQYQNGGLGSDAMYNQYPTCYMTYYVPIAKDCINHLGQACTMTWTEVYYEYYYTDYVERSCYTHIIGTGQGSNQNLNDPC